MTPEQIQTIQKRHSRAEFVTRTQIGHSVFEQRTETTLCSCGELYPCDAAKLVEALDWADGASQRREFEVNYALDLLRSVFKGLPVNGLGRAIQVLEQGAVKEETK